uniref:Ulp1 protease family, C-terminal catalytic domain containing protein n=1 Tax=Solanum tuberosum TaxID=4113 RepID=M1CT41_SOLTU
MTTASVSLSNPKGKEKEDEEEKKKEKAKVKKKAKEKEKKVKVVSCDVKQQYPFFRDCGLFVAAYAVFFSDGHKYHLMELVLKPFACDMLHSYGIMGF